MVELKDNVLKFKTFWKDKLSSEIEVNYSANIVKVKTYITNNILARPFLKDDSNITIEDVNIFFSERCFPETRENANELLTDLGLTIYNPVAIVKKTHGIMLDDYLWVQFENEEVTWNDVKIRD